MEISPDYLWPGRARGEAGGIGPRCPIREEAVGRADGSTRAETPTKDAQGGPGASLTLNEPQASLTNAEAVLLSYNACIAMIHTHKCGLDRTHGQS